MAQQLGIDQTGAAIAFHDEADEELERWNARARLGILARDRAALASVVVLVIVALAAILAPWVSPYDPNAQTSVVRFAPMGTGGHVFGTDEAGRDILSRLIWGGRVSLLTGVGPTVLAALVSLVLGLLAGYFGRWVDAIVMRTLDVFFAFPIVLLAILFAGVLGPGTRNEIIVIVIILIPYMTRVVRTAALQAREHEFVEAGRAAGASSLQIVRHEILPNVVSSLVAYTAVLCGLMILVAAGLSFFGLGPSPPTADWGSMVNSGKDLIYQAPHVALVPSVMIVIVALAFNFLGDGLRDVLDPRTTR